MKKNILFTALCLLVINAAFAQYCLPTYTTGCTQGDMIESFQTTGGINNITNLNSGCNGTAPNYTTFFSSMTHTQVKGASVNFTITPDSTWIQGYGIWVDWNQDQDFNDPGENVWTAANSSSNSVSGNFTVPVAALNGVTRMRVVGIYSNLPNNPCPMTSPFGETEDYNFEVLSNYSILQPDCGLSNGSITYTGIDTFTLNPGSITNTTGIFNNLPAGTYYVYQSSSTTTDTIVLTGQLTSTISTTANSVTATVPTNGTAPYAYSINGQPLTGPSATWRCTGTETFSITDAASCVLDTTINFVAANAYPSITLNKGVTDATCPLSLDGQITYAPSSTLTYNWIQNASVLNSTANPLLNLSPDDYVVQLHNASNECIHDTTTITSLGTNCGNISGTAFYDINTNCIQDPGDNGVSNVLITLMPGNFQTYTNLQGQYNFTGVPFGTNTLQVDTNTALQQFPICSTGQTAILSLINPNDSIDFAFDATATSDYRIHSYQNFKGINNPPGSNGRRQTIKYWISSPASPNLTSTFDIYVVMDSIHHFDYASIAPTTISGDTLIWNNQTASVSYSSIQIYFDSIANLPIGHLMPFKTWMVNTGPLILGNQTYNDSVCKNLQIINSYDPNDKSVSPKGNGPEGFINVNDSVLNYYIRFQNTGNAMAFNVSVEDSISDNLDLSTFEIIDASHTYLIEKENRLIRFKFNNIMLPDSNFDEPNSHGFIAFQIKQKTTNSYGDQMKNTAYIYFDYNPAIITNTTLNTIGWPTQIETISFENQFKVYPNPSAGELFIESPEGREARSIQVFDMLGREVESTQRKVSSNLTSIVMKANGMYILQVDGESFKIIIK